MKTNTVRMALLHSIPSPCAIPGEPPASRTRSKAIGVRIRHHLCLGGAVLLLAAAPFAAEARDLIEGYFSLPAAQAAANGTYFEPVPGGNQLISKQDAAYDLNLMRPFCGPNHVRRANVNIPKVGFAGAEAGKDYGHFAAAGSDDGGVASAAAGTWVEINDPQDRATVKLKLEIKGFASAPDQGFSTSAGYEVYVGRALDHVPRVWLSDDGCTVNHPAESFVDALATPLIYALVGYDDTLVDLQGNVHTRNGMSIYRYGVKEGEAPQSQEPMSITIEVEPNRSIVVVVSAYSVHGGLAVVDPVITAHPDNPDVEIGIPYVPDEDPAPHPLDGFTAEDFAARGIDLQPFVNLGFLAPAQPPSDTDTVAPSTTATSSPGPNASGWNNGPVTVTLAAADNPGGSGVKQIKFSTAGAQTTFDVVHASIASIVITAEGITTISFSATDNAGNTESPKTLTVKIDKTLATIVGP